MPTPNRAIRLCDADWAVLTGMAARLVRDSEMPRDAVPGAGRVSQMFRLIARGEMVVSRTGESEANQE